MAGIYIHIPFCKQACSYCNFHFSTSAKNKEQLLLAIQQEIIARASYLKDERIDSLYFGGGTPSILGIEELQSLFTSLDQNFDLSHLQEVTLEANPDDLKPNNLAEYRSMGINRLSVGIQSFHQKDLDFMRRAHSAEASLESIRQAKAEGFDKISLDLIFGIPGSDLELWRENLHQFFELDISHLSSYALTLEEGTIYHHQVEKGEINAPDEDELASQFQLLQEFINQNGWEQYELSNYCKNGDYALHNSAYWQDRKYLGLGPSAHSYDLKSRQWNLANNQLYTKAVMEGTPYFEQEEQSERDWYHDTLISRLRTKWGIPEEELHEKFSNSTIKHFKKRVDSIRQFITLEQGSYRIQRDHWFTSDNLLEKLMLDE